MTDGGERVVAAEAAGTGIITINREHERHDTVEPGVHLFTHAKRKETVYTVYANGILKTTIRTETRFTPYKANTT